MTTIIDLKVGQVFLGVSACRRFGQALEILALRRGQRLRPRRYSQVQLFFPWNNAFVSRERPMFALTGYQLGDNLRWHGKLVDTSKILDLTDAAIPEGKARTDYHGSRRRTTPYDTVQAGEA